MSALCVAFLRERKKGQARADRLLERFRRHELPGEVLKALHYALQLGHGTGLSDDQLRDRLGKLRELRILPEHRIAPD